MRKIISYLAVFPPLFLWASILSCVSIPDYRAELVNRLRILGIRSEPLEAPAGTSVTLTALVAEPAGNLRAITYLWGICPPEKSGGFGCTSLSDLRLIGLTPTVPYSLPEGASGTKVIALFVSNGPEYEIGYKRVFISNLPTPNHNPGIQALYVDGVPCTTPTCSAGNDVTLTVIATPGSAETRKDSQGTTIQERLFVSWFITAGDLKDEITVGEESQNLWHSMETGGTRATETTLYIVLRDGYGGIDWIVRNITVRTWD